LQSSNAKPEHKAEALLGIGSVHANMLNLKRDPEKALAAYRQLVRDYPDSKLREQAEAGIRALGSSGGK
jgi:outer membrane protein assembly factor BamD (BamD/ComL family)